MLALYSYGKNFTFFSIKKWRSFKTIHSDQCESKSHYYLEIIELSIVTQKRRDD